MDELDGNSPISLYYQLKEIFLAKITNREWKPNEKIPTEFALAEAYNVSRITIRQALSELEKSGYLTRKQGKGTYVSIPRIEQNLTSFYSFSEEFKKRGFKPSSRVLEFQLVAADSEIAEKLKLSGAGEQAYYIKRLRYADELVVALETTYLPASFFPGLSDSDLEEKALYDIMREEYSVIPNLAEEYIGVSQLGEKDSVYFQLKKGMAVLDLVRFAFSAQGCIEYTHSFIRGDMFRFCVKLN